MSTSVLPPFLDPSDLSVSETAAAAAGPSSARGASGAESASGAATRSGLIAAALDLFGRKGFVATSTRDIAAAARVNIAGIAYHFGGKAGLHRACAEHIAALVGTWFSAFEGASTPDPDDLSPEEAHAAIRTALGVLARFMLARPEAEAVARFMVREQMDPSPAFELVYAGLIRPRHERMCRLWARATGAAADDEEVILAVSALFGQIMFFRVGRATALRRLGWETIDDTNVERILSVVLDNLDAALASHRHRRSRP